MQIEDILYSLVGKTISNYKVGLDSYGDIYEIELELDENEKIIIEREHKIYHPLMIRTL